MARFLLCVALGLDSLAALAVMDAVRKLASTISVVCTIHQPSSEIMSKFDSMLLMRKYDFARRSRRSARRPGVLF